MSLVKVVTRKPTILRDRASEEIKRSQTKHLLHREETASNDSNAKKTSCKERRFHAQIKLFLMQKRPFSYRVIDLYETAGPHHRLTQTIMCIFSIQVH